ncbi:DUF6392 family protein [Pseudomonas sp. PSPC3-3]|uniref:DUF6392 family protein n=1 Tax=unclassified Pseudomonas TaxID=196821 RepID=UPI003CF75F1E
MDSGTLESWIKNLGGSHDHLVAQGIISNQPLYDLYGGGESLEIEPVPGVELSFWAATKRFEAIQITLRDGVLSGGMPIYTGGLPVPYDIAKTQYQVRAIFGEPLRTQGAVEIPDSIETMGGWDSYQVPPTLHNAAFIDFQYAEDLHVDRVVFSLMDRN